LDEFTRNLLREKKDWRKPTWEGEERNGGGRERGRLGRGSRWKITAVADLNQGERKNWGGRPREKKKKKGAIKFGV